MRRPLHRIMSASLVERRGTELSLLVLLAVLLELAAGTGLAFLAGFDRVQAALGSFQWIWLVATAGALGVSFIGYFYAYRGIFRVEAGPSLARGQLRAVVAAGFGGFLAHGGGKLDQYALKAAGANQEDARARASALAGMEHGILAIGGCACAIVVLVSGLSQPPPDFTLPWAIIPVPGFLIAFWAAERYRDRFAGHRGWRHAVWTFLESIHLIRELFAHPRRWWRALAGMALFWAADAFAAWAGQAAFGFQMNAAALFVGFATGMVFTRRTGPLAGAGVLALILPLTIWYSGAPFAAAIVGMFAYRILALLLPLPVSLAVLPTLRRMGRPVPHAEGVARAPGGEPALRRGAAAPGTEGT